MSNSSLMALPAIIEAFKIRNISPIETLVLVAISIFCDETGRCKMSRSDIAYIAHCSERAVTSATNELKKKGIIDKHGHDNTVMYKVRWISDMHAAHSRQLGLITGELEE